jgi:hypothetical protein
MHLTYRDSEPHTSAASSASAGEAGAPLAVRHLDGELITPCSAIESLSAILYASLEHADPTSRLEFHELDSHQREVYRSAIEELLLSYDLLSRGRSELESPG